MTVVAGRGYDRREHDALVSILSLTHPLHEGAQWQDWADRQAEACARVGCGNTHEFEELLGRISEGELERLRLGSEVARQRAKGLAVWRIALWLLALGLSAVAIALLRGRRRLAAANARLRQEMTAAQAAEEERLALERQIHQIERLQGLGLIAGGIAHDFNNLLVGVLGNADLLRLSGGLTGQDREKVLEIRASAERASALCRQLLAYAGKAPMTRGRVDLADLVRRMMPVLRSATSHGVVLRNDTLLEHARVEADESQLEQTLLNLVTNAQDAGARTVRLSVREVDRVLGECKDPQSCVALTVVDDGEGMSDEVRRKVFDPFFTTRFPGRGLGLAAVFGIVGNHGGEIDVESEPGRGTRFQVVLPRAEPTADPNAEEVELLRPPRPPAPPSKVDGDRARESARVLVVDDESAVRRLAARMLEALGMESIGAADGETALRELRRSNGSFACVLLDVTMPGLDGPTVLARMRALEPDLRIVLMSGHAERDVLGRCAEARPDALLPKPFGLDELEAAVLAAPAGAPGPG